MKKKCSCSRRTFIVSSTKAALGAAVCGNLLNSCNKMPPDILGDDENKLAIIDLKEYSELTQVGGAVKKLLEGENLELLIYRKSETEVVVVSSACTHMQFPVDLPDGEGIITCMNDGAKFDIKQGGKALSPEITSLDLKGYNCFLSGTILTIFQS